MKNVNSDKAIRKAGIVARLKRDTGGLSSAIDNFSRQREAQLTRKGDQQANYTPLPQMYPLGYGRDQLAVADPPRPAQMGNLGAAGDLGNAIERGANFLEGNDDEDMPARAKSVPQNPQGNRNVAPNNKIVTGNDSASVAGVPSATSAHALSSGASGTNLGSLPTDVGTGAPGSAPADIFMRPSRLDAKAKEVDAYTRQAAAARGIDPDVASNFLKIESGYGQAYTGDAGSSFGPFQLHYGGINPKMPHPGMGDYFTKTTGLDARDPSTWRQQVDFALDGAAANGWTPWTTTMGKLGYGPRTGLDNAAPLPRRPQQPPPVQAASPPPQPQDASGGPQSQADPMSNLYNKVALGPQVAAGYDNPQVLFDPNAQPAAKGGRLKRRRHYDDGGGGGDGSGGDGGNGGDGDGNAGGDSGFGTTGSVGFGGAPAGQGGIGSDAAATGDEGGPAASSPAGSPGTAGAAPGSAAAAGFGGPSGGIGGVAGNSGFGGAPGVGSGVGGGTSGSVGTFGSGLGFGLGQHGVGNDAASNSNTATIDRLSATPMRYGFVQGNDPGLANSTTGQAALSGQQGLAAQVAARQARSAGASPAAAPSVAPSVAPAPRAPTATTAPASAPIGNPDVGVLSGQQGLAAQVAARQALATALGQNTSFSSPSPGPSVRASPTPLGFGEDAPSSTTGAPSVSPALSGQQGLASQVAARQAIAAGAPRGGATSPGVSPGAPTSPGPSTTSVGTPAVASPQTAPVSLPAQVASRQAQAAGDSYKARGYAKGGMVDISTIPTNELIEYALQRIRRNKAASGGQQYNNAAISGQQGEAAQIAARQARAAGATSDGTSSQAVYPQGTIQTGGEELLPISLGQGVGGYEWEGSAPTQTQGAGAASTQPAASPVPNTPAVAGQTIGNVGGYGGSGAASGSGALGNIPMASPGGNGWGGGNPGAVNYNNTLNEALGTNSPTMDQIFGFNYPVPPPPKPQPVGPVSQNEINALSGIGGGSQVGTGTFAAGGAIIMDAVLRANRARRAKGKQ